VHSALVGFGAVLQGAFGRLAPVFGRAVRETASLVEMAADDAAAATCSAPRVAEALMALAHGAVPKVALAASGSDTARRVLRLSAPPRPLGRVSTLVALVGLSLGFVVTPAALVAPIAAGVIAATCDYPDHD
jgi:hypothetical protein